MELSKLFRYKMCIRWRQDLHVFWRTHGPKMNHCYKVGPCVAKFFLVYHGLWYRRCCKTLRYAGLILLRDGCCDEIWKWSRTSRRESGMSWGPSPVLFCGKRSYAWECWEVGCNTIVIVRPQFRILELTLGIRETQIFWVDSEHWTQVLRGFRFPCCSWAITTPS